MRFPDKWKECCPIPGTVAVTWVGQAGFLLKNSDGKTLALDVYLSDLDQRLGGNKRLMPALFDTDEVDADVILVSHDHNDHLDIDALPGWINKGTPLYCCKASEKVCEANGFLMSAVKGMTVGDVEQCGGYQIEAVFCDHGDYAPEAIGFIIETEGKVIYFTGDTSFQPERMKSITDRQIDLLLAPINGEYGNMNERDVAMLAAQAQPSLCIPCHFWTFARHQGSPYDYELAMKLIAPGVNSYVLAQGEIIEI